MICKNIGRNALKQSLDERSHPQPSGLVELKYFSHDVMMSSEYF